MFSFFSPLHFRCNETHIDCESKTKKKNLTVLQFIFFSSFGLLGKSVYITPLYVKIKYYVTGCSINFIHRTPTCDMIINLFRYTTLLILCTHVKDKLSEVAQTALKYNLNVLNCVICRLEEHWIQLTFSSFIISYHWFI